MPIPTVPGAVPGQEIIQAGGLQAAGPAGLALVESDAIKRMMLPSLVQTMARLEREINYQHPLEVKKRNEAIEAPTMTAPSPAISQRRRDRTANSSTSTGGQTR